MNREALKAAAHWYARLCSDDARIAEYEAHAAWLQASADHRWALQVEPLQGRLRSVSGPLSASTLHLSPPIHRERRTALKSLAVILAGGTAGWLGWRELPALTASHQTATGERRAFILADGSALTLNTASRVDVAYDAEQRLILLHAGEILVETAPDPAAVYRPLRVETRDGRIQALGTRFTVRQPAEETRVAVLRHAVALEPAEHAAGRIVLEAGNEASFTRNAVRRAETLTPSCDDWTRGMLVVADMPLGKFANELSRYRPGHLGCDPTIASLRLSGAFPVDNTDLALAAVERALPVRVRRISRYWARIETIRAG